jgi:ELWxxDGT repeat protein
LETRLAPAVLIPVTTHRDLVFDSTRQLLYITCSDGTVQRYDVVHQTLLTPWTVGTSLNGADISPDATSLYVGENSVAAGQILHKVNLADGTVTNITYSGASGEYGTFEVAISSNGTGIVTTNGTGSVYLHQLNLTTNTLSNRTDEPTAVFGTIPQDTQVLRGADRTLLFLTQPGSNGGYFTYDAASNTFPHSGYFNDYQDNTLSAVSRDGSLIAQGPTGYLHPPVTIRDHNLNVVTTLLDDFGNSLNGGVAFDPTQNILYVAVPGYNQIYAYDTTTWSRLFRLNIGETITSQQALGNGVMTVSPDSHWLFLSTPTGVRMFDLTAAPSLSVNDATVSDAGLETTNCQFTVTLSRINQAPVTLNYATADGTAVAGQDYVATNGSMVFSPSLFPTPDPNVFNLDMSHTVNVPLVGSNVTENETFSLNLSNASVAIGKAQGIGTIQNTVVVQPLASINTVSVVENSSATAFAVFTVAFNGGVSGQTYTVNYATADVTAKAGIDYTATSGSLTFAAGQSAQTIAVPVTGGVQHTQDVRFYVNISSPNSGILLSQGTATVVANAPTGVPTLSVNDVTVHKGTGLSYAVFTVTLSAASSQTVTVDCATANQSELFFSDYTAVTQTLVFQPGTTSQTLSVTIQGNDVVEHTKTFLLNLKNASNALIARGEGLGTILNDINALLSIDNVRVAEGSTGTVNAIFTVTLSGITSQTVTVNYATADGTATAGTDYQAASGTLTFESGQSASEIISVPINSDSTAEGDKNFSVNLSGPVNATLVNSTGTGTIVSDIPPTLQSANVTVQKPTSGTQNAIFTVTLPASSHRTVTVGYTTVDGTAVAGTDYQATSGTLTFAPGQTSQTVSVPVYGNTQVASDKTFTLQLTNTTAAGGAAMVIDPFPLGSNTGPVGARVLFNNALYLAANDGISGSELWKYDGSNFTQVADINPGANGSNPGEFGWGIYNGALYFSADGGVDGAQLYRYDGTTVSQVADIHNFSYGSWPGNFMVFNGKLYFTATSYPDGTQIWSTDGTTTTEITNLNPGSFSPRLLAVVSNQLVFAATTQAYGRELWEYNGTSASQVTDLMPGTQGSNPYGFVVYNGALYFSASDSFYDGELYKYDGTSVAFVASVNRVNYYGGIAGGSMTLFNGVLYFAATDESHGSELWQYDGTTVSMVQDASPGPRDFGPGVFATYDGALYFSANDGNTGYELWKFDGTSITQAADINPGFFSSDAGADGVFNGSLYTVANDGVHGEKLWTFTEPFAAANSQATCTIHTPGSSSASSFVVNGFSSPTTAGSAGTVTVTAKDDGGHVVTGYAGTVHFTSSDPQAILPADYTFTSTDAGVHSFTITLKTSGSQSLTATDTVTNTITGSQTGINVNPAAASRLAVSGFPSPATAGAAGNVTVAAKDPYGNTATGYGGTISFTSSDAQATLPGNYTFVAADAGAHTFTVTLKTSGSQSLTATDTTTSTITGSQTGITVTPAAADHLVFSVQPSNAVAGVDISPAVTVQILDRFNNLLTSDNSDSVSMVIGSNPSNGTLLGNTTVIATGGVATFSTLSITKAGSGYTLSASSGSLTGATSTNFTITASVSQFAVTGIPSAVISGQAQNVTVTAQDSLGNTVTSYAGTVRFTSTDTAAVLPANYTFVAADAGVHTFSVTLETAGTQSLTVTDTVTTSITGTEAGILVKPSSFLVNGFPSPTNAGTAQNFTVTAQNANGTTATGYTGTVHFTSSDAQAVLPVDSTLASGTGNFSATLKTAGTQSITATDTVTSSIAGTQSGITVNPLSASTLTVAGFPSPVTAGVANNFMVTAKDVYGNTATGYRGTVRFTSTDTKAALPASYTFTSTDSGVHTFTGTLKTVGTQSITGTDVHTSTITGTQSGITVNPASASAFSVTGFPSPIVAGTAGSFTVTAKDAFGNVATGYQGTVKFSSSDQRAVLAANYTFVAADSGVHTFTNGATLKTAGTQSITASDTVTSSIRGTQNGIVVTASSTSMLLVSGFPSPSTAGTAGSVTVTAADAYGNKTTSYLGTVHFTSTDPRAVLPADYTFTSSDNGVHTFTNGVTLKTAGNQSITATDTVTSSITGKQTVGVTPAAAATLQVSGYPSPTTAGAPHTFTVKAKDAYGNVATSYLGTVTFTSSDSKAVLPANYTFVASDHGIHTFSATLKTAGTQSLTATDTVTSSITGTQTGIVVNAAAASMLVVSGFPSPIAHGTSGTFTVTVEDAYGNVVTGYHGTVKFSSSDAAASLPANYTFTSTDAGVHTFTATLNTVGTQSITATDTVTSSITGTQSGIQVTAASIDQLFRGWSSGSAEVDELPEFLDNPEAAEELALAWISTSDYPRAVWHKGNEKVHACQLVDSPSGLGVVVLVLGALTRPNHRAYRPAAQSRRAYLTA